MNNLPNQLQDVFHFMSISSDYSLVGSSSYKTFLYNNDYDLNEYYRRKDTPKILNKIYLDFKDKFITAKKTH